MSSRQRPLVATLFAIMIGLVVAVVFFFVRRTPDSLAFRDSFESELKPDWSILNESATHYSFSKRRGALTITTQHGGIHAGATNARNLFLLKNPIPFDHDFEIVTLLRSFTPTAEYQQAGLICFDDPDNYVKACYLFDRRSGGVSLQILCETQGQPVDKRAPFTPTDPLWLRLTKAARTFTLSTSTNGEDFEDALSIDWKSTVTDVGLFAKNSNVALPPEADASFEFFEVHSVNPR